MRLVLWSINRKAKKEEIQITEYIPRSIKIFLGLLERFIYTTSVAINMPEAIAVYLAFKVIGKRMPSSEDNKSEIKLALLGAMYVIGNILSIIFGVLGGIIIIGDRYFKAK